MRSLKINETELNRFLQHSDDQPVVMINMLKFKSTTENDEKGEDAYNRYTQNAAPFLAAVGGHLLWYGSAGQYLIAGEADRWDRVLLVQYPSRAAFVEMINNPQFQELQKDRLAALEETVLIAAATLLPTQSNG